MVACDKPGAATRMFLRLLEDKLKIHVLALLDSKLGDVKYLGAHAGGGRAGCKVCGAWPMQLWLSWYACSLTALPQIRSPLAPGTWRTAPPS